MKIFGYLCLVSLFSFCVLSVESSFVTINVGKGNKIDGKLFNGSICNGQYNSSNTKIGSKIKYGTNKIINKFCDDKSSNNYSNNYKSDSVNVYRKQLKPIIR